MASSSSRSVTNARYSSGGRSSHSTVPYSSSIPEKSCGHEVIASVYTSMTEQNPGRRFYRCPFRRHDDCGFFRWLDPEIPQHQKQVFLRMKAERDRYEETVKILSNVEMRMSEQVKSVERKLEENNADFEKTLEEYDALHGNMERRIARYQRIDMMMTAENKKLRQEVMKLKIYILVLMVAVMVMYFINRPISETKQMLPGL